MCIRSSKITFLKFNLASTESCLAIERKKEITFLKTKKNNTHPRIHFCFLATWNAKSIKKFRRDRIRQCYVGIIVTDGLRLLQPCRIDRAGFDMFIMRLAPRGSRWSDGESVKYYILYRISWNVALSELNRCHSAPEGIDVYLLHAKWVFYTGRRVDIVRV